MSLKLYEKEEKLFKKTNKLLKYCCSGVKKHKKSQKCQKNYSKFW